MLSVSDIKKYVTPQPAVARFKPWWDRLLDLFLIGLFSIMLVSWTHIFSRDMGGVVCTYLNGDTAGIGSFEIRYVQSRCFMESRVNSVEFYPYFLLMQWAVMFACHVAWIYIPVILSRFRFYHFTINEILSVEPSFDQTEQHGYLPEIDYSDENREKLSLIHQKISTVVMDKSYISHAYRIKHYFFIIAILICTLFLVFWFPRYRFLESDFPCHLKNAPAAFESKQIACNISTSLFIYGVMVLHVLLMITMFLFTCASLIWHINFVSRVKNDFGPIFSQLDPFYKGYPGYIDMAFLLETLNLNTKDGGLVLKVIMYVLTGKYNTPRVKPTAIKGVEGPGFSSSQEMFLVKYMADEMGLEFQYNSKYKTTLFEILEKVRQEHCPSVISFILDIKTEIFYEIKENIEFYTAIFNESRSAQAKNINSSHTMTSVILKEKLKNIVSGTEWPDNLMLSAAANLLGLKFLIVGINSPHSNDPLSSDIFTPFHKQNAKAVFLGFVNPHYFYQLKISSFDSAKEEKRISYIRRKNFRNKLRLSAAMAVASHPLDHANQLQGFLFLYLGKAIRAMVRQHQKINESPFVVASENENPHQNITVLSNTAI